MRRRGDIPMALALAFGFSVGRSAEASGGVAALVLSAVIFVFALLLIWFG